MATVKITALPAASGVTSDDLVPIVNAPGSSPETQKATAEQLKTFTNTDINTTTDFKVNTNKFTVAASSGNTVVGGTLQLNGVAYTFPSTAGSNGQRLTTNGSGTLSWEAAAPAVDVQTFDTSGTWTKPATGTMAMIECWGGGGGGSGVSMNYYTGGGGGGYFRRITPLSTLGATETVTIGAGGTGGNSTTGNDGGTTSLGTLATAYGGGGGYSNGFVYYVTGGTALATGTFRSTLPAWAGDRMYNGGNSGGDTLDSSSVYGGGAGRAYNGPSSGGTSIYGGSGGWSAGANGTAPGGGGAYKNGQAGNGADGRVTVTVW